MAADWHPSMSAQPGQDVLADVHHHSRDHLESDPAAVGRNVTAMCGSVRLVRPEPVAKALPCCPLCHLALTASGSACPPKETR